MVGIQCQVFQTAMTDNRPITSVQIAFLRSPTLHFGAGQSKG